MDHTLVDHERRGSVGRIGVLVDQDEIRAIVSRCVEEHGWNPELIIDQDLDQVESRSWSLVIISSQDGAAPLILRGVKAARNPATRVLAIAEDRDPQRIADVLRSGADDYLVAPFDPSELGARIYALVSRSPFTPERRSNQLAFDFDARTIASGPMRVALSRREWDVLIALLEAEGQPLTAEALSLQVWHEAGHETTVLSTISRLRRRFHEHEFHAIRVDTARKSGYTAHFRRTTDVLPRSWAEEE